MHRITPILVILALRTVPLSAEVLYETDFESFPVGNNAWAGFDGWVSNDSTSGAQAIDNTIFAGALGNVAALGFNRPNNAFTTVFRPLNYDPGVGDSSLIEFETLFGIEDSTNSRRDNFFFSFYNMNGDLLAAIRISNVNADYGLWRQDGFTQAGGMEVDTEVEFIRGELYTLRALIDLEANRWTATLETLDEVFPLFDDVPFNGTGIPRTLGPIAMEWAVAQGSPFGYGDNWMLVDNLSIETVEEVPPPIVIDSIVRNGASSITLSWQAVPEFEYTVEYSTDLINWFSDLPNSTLAEPPAPQTFQFTDATNPLPAVRFYRVRRTISS